MSKYNYPADYDIYYPGSSIPKNTKKIKDISELQVFDKALLLKAYYNFTRDLSKKTIFDEKYFVNLHKQSFQKLYSFAGKYRNQDVSKGDTIFCKAIFIKDQMGNLFENFRKEKYLKNYSDLPKEDFADKISFYMGELIAIHPFYEFNGRLIRLFFDLIAYYNGYNYIDYIKYKHTGELNSFIEASINVVQNNNYELLKNIIFTGLKSRNIYEL
ncbi:MAG TPA: Fic family protein [Melioribacteraceae bacterium]|nr:Fic family protein [Melioribacteraceae bacterium]